MNESEKEHLRAIKGVPNLISDKEIMQIEEIVNYLPCTPIFQRVGNFIILKRVRQKYHPDWPNPGVPFSGSSIVWLGFCENMFIDDESGPCCLWVRTVCERALLRECLINKDVDPKLKEDIKNPKRKPSIKELTDRLFVAKVLDIQDLEAIDLIKSNGNAITHHKIDFITQNKGPDEVLRLLGVKEEDLNAPGFKDKMDWLREATRFIEERRMALESMECLYRLSTKLKGLI